MMISHFFSGRKLHMGSVIFLTSLWLLAATTVQAAWKPVSPDSTAERVRLVVVSEQERERPLRGIWTVLEPGQDMVFSLSGKGKLRLESRPVFTNPNDPDSFSLRVSLGDTVRRFRRHSAWEYNVRFQRADHTRPGEIRTVVDVGEVDQIGLEWPAGTGKLVVRNRARNERRILCRVLLGEGVSTVGRGSAKQPRETMDRTWGLELGFPLIGWDSNALLTAKNEPGTEAEWFLPVDFQTYFEKDLSSRTSLRAKYSFVGSFYNNPVLDERRHRFKFGGETRLGSQRPFRGTDLSYGYRFTHKNDTWNGRGDREEYETIDPVTSLPVPMGDRFDFNEHRLVAGMRKNLGRPTVAKLSMFGLVRDYIQDFAAFPDIYSLDQNQMGLELEFTWRLRRNVKLSGRVSYRAKDYDEKFSRDPNGLEVTDVPTSLRYTNFVFTGKYGRGSGPQAHAEMVFFHSQDQYAGYWDYSGIGIEGGVGWRWPSGHRIRAIVRHAQKNYDNAHLDYDSTLPLREKSVLNLKVKGNYVLSGSWEGLFRYHYKDADNNNEPFAYFRSMIIVGLTYRR